MSWGDLDPLGIVYYPNFFAWADTAANRFFRDLQLPLETLRRERNVAFGLVASRAEFHSPARYLERLVCLSSIAEVRNRVVEVVHRIERQDNSQPVVTVYETRICLDVSRPEHIRSQEIPPDIRERLQRAQLADAGPNRTEEHAADGRERSST